MDLALPASDNTPVSSSVSNPIGDAPANGRPASGGSGRATFAKTGIVQ